MRWLILALTAVAVAGCADAQSDLRYLFHGGPPADPARLVIGVSGQRVAGSSSAEADQQMRGYLDSRANQICTGGYETVKVDTLAAEEGKQIVDEELRCRPYELRFF